MPNVNKLVAITGVSVIVLGLITHVICRHNKVKEAKALHERMIDKIRDCYIPGIQK